MRRSLEELLTDVALFEDLDDDARSLIAGCGRNVHFAEDEYIFRDGEAADSFFLIRHGSVALEAFVPARGPVVIETLEAGEVLGWSWLFPPYAGTSTRVPSSPSGRPRSTGSVCAGSATTTRGSATG
jgi:CRP/FNR family transcriptional regulator, cyclic AMP receptor protein